MENFHLKLETQLISLNTHEQKKQLGEKWAAIRMRDYVCKLINERKQRRITWYDFHTLNLR